jgi:hypothetical protein
MTLMCQHAVVPRDEDEPVDLLELRPERGLDHDLDDDGLVTVLQPKFRGAILGRLLQPRLVKPFIRVRLDEVGSAIWETCDGQTKVAEIAEILADRWGDDFDPGHTRLALFLRTMEQHGFIVYR